MKKDNVWIGLIGLVVGGLIGYLVGVQSAWKERGTAGRRAHSRILPTSGESFQQASFKEGLVPLGHSQVHKSVKVLSSLAPAKGAKGKGVRA